MPSSLPLSLSSDELATLHVRAELGQVAGEVAHEINNHLQVLSGYAQLMPVHARRGDWNGVARDADMISKEVERCTALTTGVLQFSRNPQLHSTPTEDALRRAIELLGRLNRFDEIEFELEIPVPIPPTAISPALLHAMILVALSGAASVLHRRSLGRGRIRVGLTSEAERATLRIDALAESELAQAPEIPAAAELAQETMAEYCRHSGVELITNPAESRVGIDAQQLILHMPLEPML